MTSRTSRVCVCVCVVTQIPVERGKHHGTSLNATQRNAFNVFNELSRFAQQQQPTKHNAHKSAQHKRNNQPPDRPNGGRIDGGRKRLKWQSALKPKHTHTQTHFLCDFPIDPLSLSLSARIHKCVSHTHTFGACATYLCVLYVVNNDVCCCRCRRRRRRCRDLLPH